MHRDTVNNLIAIVAGAIILGIFVGSLFYLDYRDKKDAEEVDSHCHIVAANNTLAVCYKYDGYEDCTQVNFPETSCHKLRSLIK